MGVLSKHVSLVTGAGTGIGRATAIKLAAEGSFVVLVGRRLDKLEEVATQIHKSGGEALAISADVTNLEDVQNLRDQVLNLSGKIDIVVNNAGAAGAPMLVHDMTASEWDEMIKLNLYSAFYVTNAFLPKMREQQQGYVVSITSMMVNLYYEGFSGYSAAKSGLEVLMKTLAVEEAKHDIQVSVIDPGNVRSEQNPKGQQDPEIIADLVFKCVIEPDKQASGDIVKAY
ncbi:SDR family NAD(P)-dependent oxidoreductase [Niallia circulans]|uniref:SDR family NAD(P)-dependent oxidoreductase n=1 Tax=Niallia circulans TaxID=1397 RepID=UPI0015602105|nr:SDR family oxidoreductase [Niallia circulans]NRG31503.1 SDR family oxidoreductase [Niallia circulans]